MGCYATRCAGVGCCFEQRRRCGVSDDVPHDADITRPYFTRPTTEQPYYDIADPSLVNQPFAPYPLAGWAEFTYDGVPLRFGQVVQTVHREHGYGDLYQPLVVTPAISVNIASPGGIVPLSSESFPLSVSVKNDQRETADGTLHLKYRWMDGRAC